MKRIILLVHQWLRQGSLVTQKDMLTWIKSNCLTVHLKLTIRYHKAEEAIWTLMHGYHAIETTKLWRYVHGVLRYSGLSIIKYYRTFFQN